jgi:hypothetical protein
MINLTVDDRVIQAPDGSSVLSACLAAGITIPHLCWLEADTPADAPAACRLCFVEIDGFREPVTACTVTVENGMTVHTGTEAVRDLQKTAFKLLLSVHRVDCKHCPANKACALQDMAKFLGVGLGCKPFRTGAQGAGGGRPAPGFGLLPQPVCAVRHLCADLPGTARIVPVEFCREGLRYGGGLFRCGPCRRFGLRGLPRLSYGLSYRGAGGTNRCGRIAHP